MIRQIEEKLKEMKLRRQMRKFYDPDKSFLRSARQTFINRISAQPSAFRTPLHHHVIRWRYAFIVVLIIASTTAGLTTFADVNNVPARHPLYQFKRLGEQVRLNLSSPSQRVIIHQSLAQRRLEELDEIDKVASSSKEAEGLSEDFQNEADNAIKEAEHLNPQHEQKQTICRGFLNNPKHKIPANRIAHLQERCKSTLDD